MIIESSKDILFLVIAFCILWVTIFICWILYYLVMTFKRVNDVTLGLKAKIDKIGEILDLVKKKINDGAAYAGIAFEAFNKVLGHFGSKKQKSKKNTTKTGQAINQIGNIIERIKK